MYQVKAIVKPAISKSTITNNEGVNTLPSKTFYYFDK